MVQLALPVRLADHAQFDGYHAVGNEAVVAQLRRLAGGVADRICWLWGSAGIGKSHLLQAVCAAANAAGRRTTYLPLAHHAELEVALLEGLDRYDVVCADDLQSIAGQEAWERALLALYEGLAAHGGGLLVAARLAPRAAGLRLADLASRLASGPVYRLRPLPEAERQRALQLRAARRGLELSDEAARYLLRRQRRDLRSLYELLDRLDVAALVEQRRLSVPFIRDVLAR